MAEQDGLLAAAGFLPRDVASLLAAEPVIGEVLDLLQDEEIPAESREATRTMLRLVVEQARSIKRAMVAPVAASD
jgi:hypothetical protein